ncbi:MAG: metal ABC transporter substrate-binding protein [Spirochaetaceae bacterium]|jgi:zinc transport system substrate-binding protein|nr:metal ABC transporter substrate-binding protein [Spirochaetaceae bacterium]
MKQIFTGILALFFIAFFPACEGKKSAAPKMGGLKVVAVNFPAYDFAHAITGGKADILMLLPPGAESHSFEPTPKDIITIQNSDVFIYTGGESDAWVDRILESIDTSKKKIVRMMDAVDTVEEEIVEGMQDTPSDESEDEQTEEVEYDEHIWTSPRNAQRIAQAITDALCAAAEEKSNAADAALFRQNSLAYIQKLAELDAEFQAIVDGAARKTIVFGDRFPFRYFADAYGLKYFAAFPGCSTETEPSAATVAFLINKIKAEKIPVVFHIELSNEKMADAIAAETGAKKLLLHSCHNISKKDFDSGLTFLEIQKANTAALKESVQ